ncbi:MAG: PSD1 and planctomycete cytochrome C domain-containing protein [Fuerstiella sp.]|nr:PSD1 and planctomycete cytochrome C domain-containing protein [Fuerstiella sp.]
MCHQVTWPLLSCIGRYCGTMVGLWLLAVNSISAATAADFDTDVAPILIDNCLECHSGADPSGGLSLADVESARRGGESGAAIVPGDSDRSLLWKHIESGEMPPKKPLGDQEKKAVRNWIAGGAKWGTSPIERFRITTKKRAGTDWWALQSVERPEVPAVEQNHRIRNPIDAFVLRKLVPRGLQPSPEASPRVLLRRLSFDLTGLPPAPDQVLLFEHAMHQSGEAAVGHVVNRLLDSKHFGERWGRHWLDVVRFGESQGYERDKLRTDSWHYRDWVIDAFNSDMPYDEFVRLQLAGDILYPENTGAIIATGFLVAGAWDEVGQSQQSSAMKAVVRQDEIEDYVGTISQTFLGLTANCARCHDHKFDPISQKEYYQLASAVGGVRHGSRNVLAGNEQKPFPVYAVKPGSADVTYVLARGNPAVRGEVVTPGGVAAIAAANSTFGLTADSPDAARRRALAEWITQEQNPLFARVIVNRLWHYHFSAGLVATPNDFGFNGGRPSHPELLNWLASELISSGWSLKHIHRLIVTSATYRQSSRHRPECAAVDADNRLLWRKSPVRLEAEALRDSILSVTGQLNLQYGGAPYRDFTTHVKNTQFYTMTDPDSPDVYRRTVYRTWIRSGRNHLLDAFDCPDPSTTAPKRAVTTTPIQALTLMNNSFVLRMADRFAERVTRDAGTDISTQASRVYQLAYSRSPNGDEASRPEQFIKNHGLPALCRVVLNSNEFIHVD